ncbi:TetR/AcrR family transcriptional regulator [Halalkalicoccus jeotgali]|uniref:Putative transcriptional regulator n=1 Tax=Halalkalicoccus jeotgali (strain DSM 18796 / CECT 7217 / JCM 14584 / KCTC 4019 / B3) TaxID=795797 RepID=D8J7A6_HALJB|nr:TetR/AcrR family transcriptional regulator [Halalkalicoccus jeotgali]ADJ14001.1 DNA binding protein putative transcriptional regulator [Halalkalicoccus jeotgali B3]ELY33953.1 putative transcriptional regulator [Halalkalicoccus jeotgali B3]
MTQSESCDDDPQTTQEQILQATYRALHRYGYAGLTIQRIADFTDVSKSSIYYHHEDKDELLLAFLERVLRDVQAGFEIEPEHDPVADLERFLERIFASIDPEPATEALPIGAYVEIRSQAVSNAAYRERVTDIDDALESQFRSLLQQGVEQGVVKDVDVGQVSEYLLTTIVGTLERYATTDEFAVEVVRAELERYLEHRVIA